MVDETPGVVLGVATRGALHDAVHAQWAAGTSGAGGRRQSRPPPAAHGVPAAGLRHRLAAPRGSGGRRPALRALPARARVRGAPRLVAPRLEVGRRSGRRAQTARANPGLALRHRPVGGDRAGCAGAHPRGRRRLGHSPGLGPQLARRRWPVPLRHPHLRRARPEPLGGDRLGRLHAVAADGAPRPGDRLPPHGPALRRDPHPPVLRDRLDVVRGRGRPAAALRSRADLPLPARDAPARHRGQRARHRRPARVLEHRDPDGRGQGRVAGDRGGGRAHRPRRPPPPVLAPGSRPIGVDAERAAAAQWFGPSERARS